MKIIPAIDIYNGKCVRLLKGDYNLKKEYSTSPLLVAKEFENNGATHLHVVDLEGAKSNTIINSGILHDICSNTDLKVDFGGGIKTKDDISLAFDLGVNQITLGSVAVTNKDLLMDSLNIYGKEKTRPNRKMGHITIICDKFEDAYSKAVYLKGKIKVKTL